MFNKEDLGKIVELIQQLIHIELPGIKIQNLFTIEELKLEVGNKQQIYNAINVTIGLPSSPNESISARDTPKQPIDKTLPGNTPTINLQNIPFKTGFHFIINQKNWWKQEASEDKSVLIRYTKLIPVCKTIWSYVKTIEDKDRFGFQINRNGEVYVKIWADQINGVKTTELSPQVLQLFEFEEYSSGDIIQLETFPEIVISLDKSVVEKAVIVRYNPKRSHPESFIFILMQD